MLDLSPHIKSLLFDHNCVIIPDFGGFVANPQSAKINQLKSRIDPPFKEIGFNPRLTKNDGLLANHIYHEKNISYENAIQNITEVVEEIKSTVNAGKTFRMEEIGSFYLDSNKSLRFSAFNKINFNLDFFGFEPIQAISAEKREIIAPIQEDHKVEQPVKNVIPLTLEKETQNKDDDKVIPISRNKKKINWANTAMIAACVPLFLYLIWIPTRVDLKADRVNFQASDLNPFTKAPCPTYEFRGNNLPVLVKFKEDDSNIYKELVESKKPFVNVSFFEKSNPNFNETEFVTIRVSEFTSTAISTRVSHAFVIPQQSKRYYVVAGCFREYSNANNFVNSLRLKGFNSVLIDKKGDLYRVGMFGSNIQANILSSLGRAREKGFKDAWVLKK